MTPANVMNIGAPNDTASSMIATTGRQVAQNGEQNLTR
jgi:hypothetical protein